jgi:exopolysaccharide biosynthesis protein
LLIDGENVVADDRVGEDLLDEEDRAKKGIDMTLHPRTMLGFDDSGEWLLLVVVDGRNPMHSLGMSLSEQAEWMQHKGCTQAINMDGGGSSILLVRERSGKIKTINRPSSLKARPVPVMIGVRQRED